MKLKHYFSHPFCHLHYSGDIKSYGTMMHWKETTPKVKKMKIRQCRRPFRSIKYQTIDIIKYQNWNNYAMYYILSGSVFCCGKAERYYADVHMVNDFSWSLIWFQKIPNKEQNISRLSDFWWPNGRKLLFNSF